MTRPSEPRFVHISDKPRLFVADGFASPAEVDELLQRSRDPRTWEHLDTKQDATGFSFEWPVVGDPLLERLSLRAQAAAKMGEELPESLRFRLYRESEGHPPHLDNYRIGNRFLLVTALLCLEGPEEGGETAFPRAEPQPIVVRAVPGRLVVWFSHRANGDIDPYSWHEGRAILKGRKTTITLFCYRDLAFAARRVDGEPLDAPLPVVNGFGVI
jgi:hypothetical protein